MTSADNVTARIDSLYETNVLRDQDSWYVSKVPGLLQKLETYLSGPTTHDFQVELLALMEREVRAQAALWASDCYR